MVNKIQTGLLSFILLVTAPMVFAQATEDAGSSVDQFKQWLQEQDQKNEASLKQYQAPAKDPEKDAGESDIAKAAFSQLLGRTMPMTPDQIHDFKKAVDTTQRAVAIPANAPPKPMSSTLLVSLAPGEQPPAIKMSQGFISSLVFVDASGAAWPIQAYDLGNSQAFNVQWDKTTNVMMIQPLQPYTYANLAVRLKGLAPPVMLTLVPGQSVVDYRVDVTVMGQGPNSSGMESRAGLPKDASAALLGVLDGIPPEGSKAMTVSDGSGEAWLSQGVMYFRSRYTVLSPAWLDSMQSPDGMHAYQLPVTPLLLISKLGKPVEVGIQGD
ncbi:MAG: type IV secretion protein IcmK [Gammaproteobacteria bacterium]|nr:type IV secretion protein IcmK [Gammaproteobacteria bacterium]